MPHDYRLLITGASGLVGSRLCELYEGSYMVLKPTTHELDISDSAALERYLDTHKPDAVIHCAAFTDVNKAEKERGETSGLVWQTNVETTRYINDLCRDRKIFLVYISTDFVFSGTKDNPGPYTEKSLIEDDVNKVSWYGWTKGQAERLLYPNAQVAIIRISSPVRSNYDLKPDYIHKILKLFDQSKLYPMFTDQYLSLTSIDELAMAVERIIERREAGIFHVSSSDSATPHAIATYTIERARGVANAVQTGSCADFISLGRYPQYSGLSVEQTQRRLQLQFSSWKNIINAIL